MTETSALTSGCSAFARRLRREREDRQEHHRDKEQRGDLVAVHLISPDRRVATNGGVGLGAELISQMSPRYPGIFRGRTSKRSAEELQNQRKGPQEESDEDDEASEADCVFHLYSCVSYWTAVCCHSGRRLQSAVLANRSCLVTGLAEEQPDYEDQDEDLAERHVNLLF
ncbi:MAG: hypothetical protein K2X77_33880 [Candidatus Obscuribacterales bacterium]|nr:hypothetical protein [Candidatus Obscuribacterales bacterium]